MVMKDFKWKWIIKENIPCWYELSWSEKEPAIILRVHPDFARIFPVLLQDNPSIAHYIEKFKFEGFSGDLTRDFGFAEGLFINQGEKDEFVEYLIPIPKIKVRTDNPCEDCNGTGKDPLAKELFQEDRECIHCNGDGKKRLSNWKSAYAVSATFTCFFRFAHYPEKETSSPLPQLMIVETITDIGMHGGSLGGKFSVPLVEWLSSLYQDRDTLIPEISRATKSAHKCLFGKLGYFDDHYFRAYVGSENGGLVADCPGDACGIHPSGWPNSKGKGYEFGSHNVDSAAQQITLLAGLAALHDRARREIRSG